MNIHRYRKALVAIVAVVLTGLNNVYGGSPDVQLLISLATAVGVFQVKNVPLNK